MPNYTHELNKIRRDKREKGRRPRINEQGSNRRHKHNKIKRNS